MNETRVIPHFIERGEQWLLRQHEHGCYRHLAIYEGDFEPKPGQPSLLATAYAAHYWAWTSVFRVGKDSGYQNAARTAADWLVRYWHESQGRLPGPLLADKASPFESFFDLGIAARALMAVHQATKRDEYADVATQMATRMRRFQGTSLPDSVGLFHPYLMVNGSGPMEIVSNEEFERGWWSNRQGPYQRKAALAMRLIHDRQSYDALDLAMSAMPMEPPAVAVDPVAAVDPDGKKRKPADVNAETAEAEANAQEKRNSYAADYCLPHAYSAEALLMSQYSHGRALEAIELLGERIASTPIIRTDAFAQWCRLRLLTGERERFPVRDIEQLCNGQHPSGGWPVFLNNPDSSRANLVFVPATIFALQALWIYSDRSKRSDLPGPLVRRELALV